MSREVVTIDRIASRFPMVCEVEYKHQIEHIPEIVPSIANTFSEVLIKKASRTRLYRGRGKLPKS